MSKSNRVAMGAKAISNIPGSDSQKGIGVWTRRAVELSLFIGAQTCCKNYWHVF